MEPGDFFSEEHHWFKAEDAVIDLDTSDLWDKGCPSLLVDELFAMDNRWLRGLNYGAPALAFPAVG